MPNTIKSRFGAIEYAEGDIIVFPDGLIGFPQCTRFIIVSRNPDSPFRWLQCIEWPEFAFLVADPLCYVSDYEPVLGDSQAAELSIDPETPTLLYTTVSIPRGKPEEMSINLAGPIVINTVSRVGRQLVLDNEAYTIKHRVFQGAETQQAPAAA